uniref:Carn_acyltransf domain-containing protein n=1 Tax=Steinernema glaseri TaxID=37863 RepID=A0A1I7ZMZ8_9BILA
MMDAVPWKFVDSVVELFGKKTLEELALEVQNPLWKAVVDLHHRSRVYYTVTLCKQGDGIGHFVSTVGGAAMSCYCLSEIRVNGRFARIVRINDGSSRDIYESSWSRNCRDETAETAKLLESIITLIDQDCARFDAQWGSIYGYLWYTAVKSHAISWRTR